MNDRLAKLREELRTQDAALESAKQQLAHLGDVQIQIPEELLEQLDDTCKPHVSTPLQPGALRA